MVKRKYFKRLFIIYFLMMLVYGLILTSFFVYQNRVSLNQQQVYNDNAQAKQAATHLEQKLWSLNKYTETLFQDTSFGDYLIINDNYYIYTKVQKKLQSDMAVFTDIGARIAVTKWVDDFVISNQYTRDLYLFQEEMAFTDHDMDKIKSFYYSDKGIKEVLVLHQSDSGQLHIIKKRKANTFQYVLLIMSVDEKMMSKGLENASVHFYLKDEMGQELQSLTVSDDGVYFDEEGSYRMIGSDVFEEIFFVITQSSSSGQGIEGVLLVALGLMGLMLLAGYVIAFLLAKRTYRPIGKVLSSFGDFGDAVDEFSYIQNQTDIIVEANQQLKKVIEEQQLDLRTKVIRDMLNGRINNEDATDRLVEYGLEWIKGYNTVALIELQEMVDVHSVYSSKARMEMRQNLQTIIENTLTLEGAYFDLIELSYNTYGLILKEKDRTEAVKLLNTLLTRVEASEEMSIRIALGDGQEGLEGLRLSYDQARSLLDFRTSYDQRALVTSEEVVSDKFYYTLEQERELYQATISGFTEKIEVIFDRLIRNNVEERSLSQKEELNLFMSLATTYRRIEQKVDDSKEVEGPEGDHMEEALKGMNSDENSMTAVLHEFKLSFLQIAKAVKAKNETTDTEMSTMMIGFIEDHYNEDISLEEAATSLNISAGYFCSVFKKHTGNNFKSYLNLYRVTKAKEIIAQEPNIKVKDLTTRVGYNNVNSFIRMFKKHEGISPGEYAKRINIS